MKIRWQHIGAAFLLGFSLAAGSAGAISLDDTGPVYLVNGVQTPVDTAQLQDDLKQLEPLDAVYVRYTDYASGYSLLVPRHMQLDLSAGAVRTVFGDQATQIEVYYDNFAGTISNATDYIYYGNRQIVQSPEHTVIRDEWISVAGSRAHVLEWERRKLARVENDKNHYLSIEIIKNENEVYTLLIKSCEQLPDALAIIQSFQFVERTHTARNYKEFRPAKTTLNSETAAFSQQYLDSSHPVIWGIFEPSAPDSMSQLTELEKKLEYKFPLLIRYQSLNEQLPVQGLEKAYKSGRTVELTLQTTKSEDVNALLRQNETNAAIMYSILDGYYDDYLNEYARRLKAFGHPIIFRLNNEMNGDWCWYSAYYTGKDTDIYKNVWRYLRKIFDENGVDNVLWVWNPHDVTRPDFKWNHYLMYYPGDEYVDVIGLTGYNTGTYFEGEQWRSFEDIYPRLYAEYGETFAKPFIITEFGSNSIGGDKSAWINDMFNRMGRLPNIKAAIWWSGTDYDPQGNAGRIYRLDENEATMEVFHTRLQEYNSENPVKAETVNVDRCSLTYPLSLSPHMDGFNQAIRKEADTFAAIFSDPELSGRLDYRVNRNSGVLLSVTLKKFQYRQHAAHPLTVWTSLTYDSRSNKLLTLRDLFKPNYPFEAELNRRIAEQINERRLPLLLPFTGIHPDQEFWLTPDSLTLYYQLYDYTAYAYGFLTFTIPLEDIDYLLKSEYLPAGARKGE